MFIVVRRVLLQEVFVLVHDLLLVNHQIVLRSLRVEFLVPFVGVLVLLLRAVESRLGYQLLVVILELLLVQIALD